MTDAHDQIDPPGKGFGAEIGKHGKIDPNQAAEATIRAGVMTPVEAVRAAVFIGSELGPWMKKIPEDGAIDQWCQTVANLVLEADAEAKRQYVPKYRAAIDPAFEDSGAGGR